MFKTISKSVSLAMAFGLALIVIGVTPAFAADMTVDLSNGPVEVSVVSSEDQTNSGKTKVSYNDGTSPQTGYLEPAETVSVTGTGTANNLTISGGKVVLANGLSTTGTIAISGGSVSTDSSIASKIILSSGTLKAGSACTNLSVTGGSYQIKNTDGTYDSYYNTTITGLENGTYNLSTGGSATVSNKTLTLLVSGASQTITLTGSGATKYKAEIPAADAGTAHNRSIPAKRAVSFTITGPSTNPVADGSSKASSVNVVPSISGFTAYTVNFAKNGSLTAAPTEAGTYTVSVSLTDAKNYYIDGTPSGSLTIGPAPVGPTAPNIAIWPTYGTGIAGNLLSSVTINQDAVVKGNVAGTFSWENATSTTLPSNTNLASYKMVFTPSDATAYTAVTSPNAFPVNISAPPINKTPITLSVDNTSQTYNGSERLVTIKTTTSGVTLNTEDYTVTYTAQSGSQLTNGKPVDAGKYNIVVALSAAGEQKYTANTLNAVLEVARAEIAVKKWPVLTGSFTVNTTLTNQDNMNLTGTGAIIKGSNPEIAVAGNFQWVPNEGALVSGTNTRKIQFVPTIPGNYTTSLPQNSYTLTASTTGITIPVTLYTRESQVKYLNDFTIKYNDSGHSDFESGITGVTFDGKALATRDYSISKSGNTIRIDADAVTEVGNRVVEINTGGKYSAKITVYVNQVKGKLTRPKNIVKSRGTDFERLKLPEKVFVSLDGSNRGERYEVYWDESDYNENDRDTQIIYGSIDLPAYVDMDDTVVVKVYRTTSARDNDDDPYDDGGDSYDDFWSDVVDEINWADSGDRVTVDGSSYSKMPVSVLEALKGTKVTLVVERRTGSDIRIYGKNVGSIPTSRSSYTYTELYNKYHDSSNSNSSSSSSRSSSSRSTASTVRPSTPSVPQANTPVVPSTPAPAPSSSSSSSASSETSSSEAESSSSSGEDSRWEEGPSDEESSDDVFDPVEKEPVKKKMSPLMIVLLVAIGVAAVSGIVACIVLTRRNDHFDE